MNKAIAIIGSFFGDEGKGLVTDYYAAQHPDSIVVRFNGGAQAGHTVTTPEGERHVFSHFGSGTLLGRPTYLSEFFVCNPFIFQAEHKQLTHDLGRRMSVFVHPDSPVTIPFDMRINHLIENARGDGKHGSCGIGFGETLERGIDPLNRLTFANLDLMADGEIYHALDMIRKNYVQERLEQLGLPDDPTMGNHELIVDFIEAFRFMQNHVEPTDYTILKDHTLIFEGAQGLLLDQDYGDFPHVTRSNCGMKNVSLIRAQIPSNLDLTVNYVTRAYTTRHGAGPLYNEMPLPYNIIDETNIHNEYQGTLRFAPFKLNTYLSMIGRDNQYRTLKDKVIGTMTCLDQLGDRVLYMKNGDLHDASRQNFFSEVSWMVDLVSFGPTREDVKAVHASPLLDS